MTGALCGPESHVVSRRSKGDPRWCFRCRKVREFERVVIATVEPSYYEPVPQIRCVSCGLRDGDLFPGRFREWDW